MKRQTLENAVASCLPDNLPDGTTFDVFAWELWGNRKEGFTVNDGWKIARETDLAGLKEAARGRWEVFKVNYFPRALVSGIDCHGGKEWDAGTLSPLYLEYEGTSFLEIRFNLPPPCPDKIMKPRSFLFIVTFPDGRKVRSPRYRVRRDAVAEMEREGCNPHPDGTRIQLFKSNRFPDFNSLSLPPA